MVISGFAQIACSLTGMLEQLQQPQTLAFAVGVAGWILVAGVCMLRARRSRYPALLWTCAGYMTLLHAVWLAGVASGDMLDGSFGTIMLLTFPWSMLVVFHMSMAGFRTLHDLLLNYSRFVLGFGGIQCLLLTLFVWELRLRPRQLPR